MAILVMVFIISIILCIGMIIYYVGFASSLKYQQYRDIQMIVPSQYQRYILHSPNAMKTQYADDLFTNK